MAAPGISPGQEPGSGQGKLKRAVDVMKASAVAIALILALYYAAGSYLYGPWWYAFVWQGYCLNLRFIRNGLTFLLDEHFLWSAVFAIALFLSIVFLNLFASRVRRFTDRAASWVLLIASFSILLTAMLDRHFFKGDYDESDFFGAFVESNSLSKPTFRYRPVLEGPIQFKFLNQNEIDALYSQITPELIERERNIETNEGTEATASISAGAMSADVKGQKGVQSKSSLERVDFSPERKAIETINFCLQNSRCAYYSFRDLWLLDLERARLPNDIAKMSDLLKKNDTTSAEYKAVMDRHSKEYAEAQRKQHEEDLRQLESELAHISGLIFVEGEYAVKDAGDEVTLTHSFGDDKHPVQFETILPSTPELRHLSPKSFLHVFGSVESPLGKQKILRIETLALY